MGNQIELKPCPFCGAEATIESFAVRKGFEANIMCTGCLVNIPTITYDTEQEAILAVERNWNRRAGDTE